MAQPPIPEDSTVERTTEPKIVLLVRLLNAIDEARFSFEDLKERIADGDHRPSTRSLRRYLAILSDAGFPWYFDRPSNTYRFAGGYSLKRLELNSSELFGLVALRAISSSLGGSIGTYVDDVTAKLLGSSGKGAKERVEARSAVTFRLSEIRLDEVGEKAFEVLSAAERSTRSVTFTYRDKEGKRSERTVDPYGFIVSAGRVYCVAFDPQKHDKRVFAVDNVSEPVMLARTFVKPSDFNVEEFAATSISGVLHGADSIDVKVRFASRVAKAAVAARAVAERAIVHLSDGSVEISYRVSDAGELVRWVLGWGDQAEVVGPAEVRERARDLIGDLSRKYGRPQPKRENKTR
ncbi:MAG: WYL domain-containing protein [Candidatus Eremiobacteraeota bacterium]|nr:WYL domain-containing protein [Candidatus Eremiobacteraeota bacterium]